jgi:hypothetical protein
MELRTSAFCSLARSADWQVFLDDIAPDLCRDLKHTIKTSKGCRANSNKMMEIYFELDKRGLKNDLEVFLKRRFPWIIKHSGAISHKSVQKIAKETQVEQVVEKSAKNWNNLNKHGVFRMYRPDVLSFPQKFILIGTPETLYGNVQEFIRNKLAVDYIIIENYAYIEYFDAKYATVVDRIPRESREIYKYRQKLSQ